METSMKKKILLAVDGSDQALEAVRYISSIVAPERTEIVLFYVGSGFPEVFWDLNRNPLYHTKKAKVMGWLADHQLVMGEFMEKATHIFDRAGFTPQSIQIKTQTQKTAVLTDILQESYRGYSAVVMGRSGVSRLKDLVMGSLAYKLSEKIKHVPSVVVAGRPEARAILIALDDSIEAMRGVHSAAVLADAADLTMTLCHVVKVPGRLQGGGSRQASSAKELDWLEYHTNKFRPFMEEATERLLKVGVNPERIHCDFISASGSPIEKILETAQSGQFGTIVVGRREAVSLRDERIRGRFSHRFIKAAENIAVWVVG